MINEEKTKHNLLLAYMVSVLYVKSLASATEIGTITEIPRSSVKRYINTIKNRKNDYLRLLPKLISEDKIVELIEKIEQCKMDNKNNSKENETSVTLNSYREDIEKIKDLYKKSIINIDDNKRMRVNNLRLNGKSFREIAKEEELSLATVHGIVIRSKQEESSKEDIDFNISSDSKKI